MAPNAFNPLQQCFTPTQTPSNFQSLPKRNVDILWTFPNIRSEVINTPIVLNTSLYPGFSLALTFPPNPQLLAPIPSRLLIASPEGSRVNTYSSLCLDLLTMVGKVWHEQSLASDMGEDVDLLTDIKRQGY